MAAVRLSSKVSIFACESLTLLYTFVINIAAVTVPFLFSVSSKLCVPQTLAFAFWASNSPLPPAAGKERGEESGGAKNAAHDLENLSEDTDLQSTIPTAQHQV